MNWSTILGTALNLLPEPNGARRYKKIDQADIIFFMISENLMSTKYVMENEVKNTIDKYNKGLPIKIIPILMAPYRFTRMGKYDLSSFSALPYNLQPVILS